MEGRGDRRGGVDRELADVRAGGEQLGWGFQLQSPIFVFGLTVFLLIFALNYLPLVLNESMLFYILIVTRTTSMVSMIYAPLTGL